MYWVVERASLPAGMAPNPQSRGRGGAVRLVGFVGRRDGLVLGSLLMANCIGGVVRVDFWVRFVIFFFWRRRAPRAVPMWGEDSARPDTGGRAASGTRRVEDGVRVGGGMAGGWIGDRFESWVCIAPSS